MRFSLESFLHEILVLATDFQVLCRKNCHGLCSGCGCDLNYEACRCSSRGLCQGHTTQQKKNNISSPFAVLSSIIRDKVHDTRKLWQNRPVKPPDLKET